jgi:hypothetical protein
VKRIFQQEAIMFRYVALATVCWASAAAAQGTTVQQTMPFETCVQTLQTSSATATQPSTTTVDTYDTKQVQFAVPTGQVTITCSRSSQQVTISHQ